MADQKNRGGQKQENRQGIPSDQGRGTAESRSRHRSGEDKRADQTSNPDDAKRQPTNEQR